MHATYSRLAELPPVWSAQQSSQVGGINLDSILI